MSEMMPMPRIPQGEEEEPITELIHTEAAKTRAASGVEVPSYLIPEEPSTADVLKKIKEEEAAIAEAELAKTRRYTEPIPYTEKAPIMREAISEAVEETLPELKPEEIEVARVRGGIPVGGHAQKPLEIGIEEARPLSKEEIEESQARKKQEEKEMDIDVGLLRLPTAEEEAKAKEAGPEPSVATRKPPAEKVA